MLTLREALELPVFAGAELVAGHAGLENQVRWVHIVDIPDARYEWKRTGVLLLTAGYGLRADPQRQAALVPKLVQQGFSGLVLSTGHYFESSPEIIIEKADALGFPVIETPPDLLFIDVTEAVLEQIISRQFHLLQQSTQIHAGLTDLVLKGGHLNELAETLAGFLQRAITIEDPSFYVLAAARSGPVDEARKRSVSRGRTTPEVAQRLIEHGIYDRLLQSMAPLRVPPMPDLGMDMDRIVAPIIVDREIHGYIWIIAGDHPLTDLDEMAISRAATIAALIMFKEQAVRHAGEALRGDFFEQLLAGGFSSSAFLEQARRFDLRLDRSYRILVIHALQKTGGIIPSIYPKIENWLRSKTEFSLLIPRQEHLVLVMESNPSHPVDRLAGALVADLSHPACRLLIGVGGHFEVKEDQVGDIQGSYAGAREAVHIALALGQEDGVVPFDELGVLHWLYHLPAEVRAENKYLIFLDKVASYDAGHGTQLVKTLEAYLDHGGSLIETAESLYIHRNTLIHRLERIEQLCQLDLRQPAHRLNLHVALKSARLHGKL